MRGRGLQGVVKGGAGLSMLEVVVALTLVAAVVLASVQLVTRAVAQIGSARTEQAEHPARAKTVALQWLQGELDYLRSRGYGYLTQKYLDPGGDWVRSGAAVRRTITRTNKEPGESALPPGFEKAEVILEVEGLEGCPSNCVIAVMRARVRLYRQEGDPVPFVEGATSVVRR
ncbi:MAG: hypothetical protein QN193_04530 [Armatimonadota bacterium]|nr:hypothetical protein [Armatimonadota bacterium]MDR7445067.1 hypothetical protein [Armatimonadota bacterium]MDR7569852.1 hypothetical protein [Armatimonadota bacterium]MDR7614153.1 hypothetical protein [Armatimonadota bacterium]